MTFYLVALSMPFPMSVPSFQSLPQKFFARSFSAYPGSFCLKDSILSPFWKSFLVPLCNKSKTFFLCMYINILVLFTLLVRGLTLPGAMKVGFLFTSFSSRRYSIGLVSGNLIFYIYQKITFKQPDKKILVPWQ